MSKNKSRISSKLITVLFRKAHKIFSRHRRDLSFTDLTISSPQSEALPNHCQDYPPIIKYSILYLKKYLSLHHVILP